MLCAYEDVLEFRIVCILLVRGNKIALYYRVKYLSRRAHFLNTNAPYIEAA